MDEMQGGEVELRSLVLLFLLPVRLFDVLQILFPLPRLLVCSAVLHRSQKEYFHKGLFHLELSEVVPLKAVLRFQDPGQVSRIIILRAS